MKNKYEQDLKPRCNKLIIESIDPGSIAEEVELESGDIIHKINSKEVFDELDFILLTSDDYFNLEVEKQNGEIWDCEIEKDIDEELGIHLADTLSAKTCENNCIFCFIDQMPDGMRESLYIKDDDERLSFLNGNYVTLTNLSDREIDRICEWKIPINISIHTTNPKLRRKILGNYKAGKILQQLEKLFENKVEMNAQIVLIPDFNDLDLVNTIKDLEDYIPYLKTVSVVPVGLTKHRDGLAKLRVFTQREAEEIVDTISLMQEEFIRKYETPFVFLSDEFYLLAKREFPDKEIYGNFDQLENGVGMVPDFEYEFLNELGRVTDLNNKKNQLIITGKLFEPKLVELTNKLKKKFTEKVVEVLGVENSYFGDEITVTGLLTGKDIIKAIKEHNINEIDEIIIPETILRTGTEILLDDLSVLNVEEAIGKPVRIVNSDAKALIHHLLEEEVKQDHKTSDNFNILREAYE